MTDPNAFKARRFRRAALAGSALALLLFLWAIAMMLHFNAGPASVRFGFKTMLNIASIGLPGPVLLAFLAWNAKVTPCRVVGWVSLLPVVGLAGIIGVYASIELRPPLFYGDYDAAIIEGEAAWRTVNDDSDNAHTEFKSLYTDWKRHPRPGTREEISGLRDRLKPVIESTARTLESIHVLKTTMSTPFDRRTVSARRRDEYMRLSFGPLNFAEYEKSYVDVLAAYRAFEQRLTLMLDNFGAWHWTDENLLKFDDPAVGDEYNRLIEVGKNLAP